MWSVAPKKRLTPMTSLACSFSKLQSMCLVVCVIVGALRGPRHEQGRAPIVLGAVRMEQEGLFHNIYNPVVG